VVIVPEARSNTILLRSENPQRLARVRALIEQLDTPTSKTGNVHILYPEERGCDQGCADAARGDDRRGAGAADPGRAGHDAARRERGPVRAAGNRRQSVPASGSGTSVSANGVMIQADTNNNALIINAPEAIYNNLRAVVELLDVRRAQIYVEVLICEITAERAASSASSGRRSRASKRTTRQVIGGTNFNARGSGRNIIDTAVSIGSAGPGTQPGVVRGQVFIPGIGTIANLGFPRARARIGCQREHPVDAEPADARQRGAKVVIGQNVPFITGQYAQTGTQTTPTPFQTIERRDVGLTLRVKPQITEGGTVRLAIFQEVSSVQDLTINNAAGPITNKRSLESNVLVDDGQIIVLGGLLQDALSNGQDKVPLLGDVPFVGKSLSLRNTQAFEDEPDDLLRP
jgi:general secretion pathway protein D